MTMQEHFNARLQGTHEAVASIEKQVDALASIADVVVSALRGGGTVYTCGNGGSAAEAMHLAEELIGRYRGNERPALRAICLNADATALTCIANDFGYDRVFQRQCEALVTEKDVLVALSTSGNSENIIRALDAARKRGATAIALLGKGGGSAKSHADHALIVAGEDSAHIQEAHLVVVHLICEAVELRVISKRS